MPLNQSQQTAEPYGDLEIIDGHPGFLTLVCVGDHMLPTVNPDDRFLINGSQERYVGPGCCFIECLAGLFRHWSEARLGVAIGFSLS
jgi:hypothetical protein